MRTRWIAGPIFGAVALISLVGCGGSNNLPGSDNNQTPRSISGFWRRTAIGSGSTTVSCPDPENLVGSPTRDLAINGIVFDACASTDGIAFTTSDSNGKGRYRRLISGNTEDGSYDLDGNGTLTLVRDRVNDNYLTALSQANQRIVFSVSFAGDGQFVATPVVQNVSLRALSTPTFREDGSLIDENVAPVANGDGTINAIVLPTVDFTANVNPDLSITIAPSAVSGGTISPPGFARERGTDSTYTFVPFVPGRPQPIPAPAIGSEG